MGVTQKSACELVGVTQESACEPVGVTQKSACEPVGVTQKNACEPVGVTQETRDHNYLRTRSVVNKCTPIEIHSGRTYFLLAGFAFEAL